VVSREGAPEGGGTTGMAPKGMAPKGEGGALKGMAPKGEGGAPKGELSFELQRKQVPLRDCARRPPAPKHTRTRTHTQAHASTHLPPRHAAFGHAAFGHGVRLQAGARAVAGRSACGCRAERIRLQAGSHTVAGAAARRLPRGDDAQRRGLRQARRLLGGKG
jgi:hypothetical protein